ncbi:MAG: AcrVA2 family anti-CRISPR protein [Steroidobacteraceae bacterium]
MSRLPSRPLTHRAREILATVGHAYPAAWQQVDSMRASRGKGLPQWPEWCFLPTRYAHAIAAGGSGRRLPYEHSHYPSLLGALAAWRVSQGIYRFDRTLYDALTRTPLIGDLPHEPLYRLPEWCVYVETPDLIWPIPGEERPIHGAWGHLDWDERIGSTADCELRLVLDTARSPRDALDPLHGCIPIPLIRKGTITDSLDRVLMFGIAQARARGLEPPPELKNTTFVARILWPIVSLLLYICTESGEIGDVSRRPLNPQPKRTRHGPRLFPPDRPTAWDVGVRIGAALRRAYQDEPAIGSVPTGRRLRGHVRIFHWHTFLAGPDRTERRLKWLPLIPVNLKDPDLLPATVRRVG